MIFFKNLWLLFTTDFSRLHELQAELYSESKDGSRNRVARELNFEVKSKISMKVHRWHRKTEFSDEMVKEAESIQLILNEIFNQAEVEDEKELFVNEPEVIMAPSKPQVISGLGSTNRR